MKSWNSPYLDRKEPYLAILSVS